MLRDVQMKSSFVKEIEVGKSMLFNSTAFWSLVIIHSLQATENVVALLAKRKDIVEAVHDTFLSSEDVEVGYPSVLFPSESFFNFSVPFFAFHTFGECIKKKRLAKGNQQDGRLTLAYFSRDIYLIYKYLKEKFINIYLSIVRWNKNYVTSFRS